MVRTLASSSRLVIAGIMAIVIGTAVDRVSAAEASCIGDCNETQMIEIIDLIIGLRIAIGADPVSACPAWDPDGSGSVTISELTQGINEALHGCPAIIPEPNRCGDGRILGGEQCDDGNTADGDGCSATCEIEGPGVVDQIWNGCEGSGGSININYAAPTGQQFTPTAATLTGVAVRVDRQVGAPGTPSLTVRIHAGSIDGPLLGEDSRTVTADGPVLFTFTTPVSVVPGMVHVIELVTSDPYLNWVRAGGDASCTYAGGAPIFFGSASDNFEDLLFATYTVP